MKKLMLIILISTLALNSFAQADQHWLPKKISISVKEMPLEQVLKELEEVMEGVVFAYSPGAFDVKKKVSIEAEEMPLNEILHEIFENQNLECAEMRGKIFLKRKKKTTSGKQGTASVRRKRILKADVRNVSVSGQKKANQASASPDKQQRTKSQSPKISATTKTGSSEQISKPNQQISKQNEPREPALNKPATAITDLVAELTTPGRVRSASVRKAVSPIQKEQAFSGFNQYRSEGFSQSSPPPMPVDTSRVKLVDFKLEKEKKKREKKDQAPREPEEKKFRLYGASTTALTGIGGDAAIKMGGRAVWLKNSRFGIGLAGYAIQGPSKSDAALSNDSYRLAGGYGGLLLEYNVNPHKAIHLSFPLVVAGGAMTYLQQEPGLGNVGNLDGLAEDQRVIAIVEPGAMLVFNVIKYVKVALDVSYRYASHSELNYQDTGEVILAGSGLNTFSGGITLKFGIF